MVFGEKHVIFAYGCVYIYTHIHTISPNSRKCIFFDQFNDDITYI